MQIDEHLDGTVAVLTPKGRLTHDNAREFTERVRAVLDGGTTRVLLDLRDVSELDSAGAGAIAGAYVSACRRGGGCKLVHFAPQAHRALVVTRLHTILESFDSEAAARRSFDTGTSPADPGPPRRV